MQLHEPIQLTDLKSRSCDHQNRSQLNSMIIDYEKASAMALKCPLCGSKPVMGYDVGCSHASCSCGVKLAIPDGDARTLLRLWNQFMLQDELTQETANRLTNENEKRTKARMGRN